MVGPFLGLGTTLVFRVFTVKPRLQCGAFNTRWCRVVTSETAWELEWGFEPEIHNSGSQDTTITYAEGTLSWEGGPKGGIKLPDQRLNYIDACRSTTRYALTRSVIKAGHPLEVGLVALNSNQIPYTEMQPPSAGTVARVTLGLKSLGAVREMTRTEEVTLVSVPHR